MEKLQIIELYDLGSIITKFMLIWITGKITGILNMTPKKQKRKWYRLGSQILLGSNAGATHLSKSKHQHPRKQSSLFYIHISTIYGMQAGIGHNLGGRLI